MKFKYIAAFMCAIFIAAVALFAGGCEELKEAIEEAMGEVNMPDFQIAVSLDGKDAPQNVRCGVTAIDKDGDPVRLQEGDVRIYESQDRESWTEREFTSERRSEAHFPISAAVVMDYSGSMSDDQRKDSEDGVITFTEFLEEGDRLAIIKFGTDVEVKQDFTDDAGDIESALDDPYTGDTGTSLWDASKVGVDMAATEDAPKAVLAFTDGADSGNGISADNLIDHAIGRGVPVYTLGMTCNLFGIALEGFLKDLVEVADETGGLFFKFPDSGDMEQIYVSIAKAFDEALLTTWATDFSGGTVYVKVKVQAEVGGKTYEESVISTYRF